jgi:hypothetical protein
VEERREERELLSLEIKISINHYKMGHKMLRLLENLMNYVNPVTYTFPELSRAIE